MIKTLRITSFLTAVTALGFFIFIAARGLAADEKVEAILKLPGVAEQFQADFAGRRSVDSEAETPLVKQAKALALRINPPPPPRPVRPKPSPVAVPRPQAPVSAKFKLIGTSYHFGEEADSLALIDEVGKGLHWVKQGGKVGHLTIEKIGDGKVLINDNGKTYELIADREKRPDLVKSYTGPVSQDSPIVLWDFKEEAAEAESAVPASVPSADNAATSVPEPTPEEIRRQTQENIEWLKNLQNDPNSLGMTAEEANELSGLGELLKSLENEVERLGEANDSNSTTIPDVNQQDEQSLQEQQAYSEEALEAQEQQIQEEMASQGQDEQSESETPTGRPRPRK
ncbi:MAG: hypothetical protein KKI18_04475 [Planctomycetes bacterium]|nr:hypothetical protein [Planctomycetota bacterium]